jgi:O-antigen ligase
VPLFSAFTVERLAFPAALTTCAWGVLAFGAVYPWAYWPMLAGTLAIAALVFARRQTLEAVRSEPLMWPLAGVVAAIALQVVPLSPEWLDVLSSPTRPLVDQLDLSRAVNRGSHAISIQPHSTRLALGFAVVLSALILAMSRVFTAIGVRRFAVGLAALGLLVALSGIIQRPLFAGKIYGFWEPAHRTNSFGPFVNPNHFAGWMAMALPVTLGLICSRISRAMRRGVRGWRDVVRWLSSPSASGLILLMMAAATMGLSLVLSLSRSGILCFLLAVLLTTRAVVKRQRGFRRLAAAGYLATMAVCVLLWVGPATLAGEFSTSDWTQVQGRIGAWRDAVGVGRAFPLTGTGLNTYGYAMRVYQRHDMAAHYTAAHNDYLQLAAEGGLLVGIPAIWVFVVLCRSIRRRFLEQTDDAETYWIRIGAVTGLVAIALQEVVDFSLQIPGNALLFGVLCAIAIHSPSHRAAPST